MVLMGLGLESVGVEVYSVSSRWLLHTEIWSVISRPNLCHKLLLKHVHLGHGLPINLIHLRLLLEHDLIFKV